mmetsp:Transcript_42321/g.116729  ORF Transcript_42321/g.116729 Transcript_42321/m.116729 type:complete len:205 (+) Transcript_42321:91-705(+)
MAEEYAAEEYVEEPQDDVSAEDSEDESCMGKAGDAMGKVCIGIFLVVASLCFLLWTQMAIAKAIKHRRDPAYDGGPSPTMYALCALGCLGTTLGFFCCYYPVAASIDVFTDFLVCLPTWLEKSIDGAAVGAVAALACGSACLWLIFVTGFAFMFYYPLQAAIMMGISVCLCCGACGYLASRGQGDEADEQEEMQVELADGGYEG